MTITIEENFGARALRRFLLGKCAESFRLAMAAYWLLAAAAEAEVRGDTHFEPSHALSRCQCAMVVDVSVLLAIAVRVVVLVVVLLLHRCRSLCP